MWLFLKGWFTNILISVLFFCSRLTGKNRVIFLCVPSIQIPLQPSTHWRTFYDQESLCENFLTRQFFKKKRLSMAHALKPSNLEEEAGRSLWAGIQSGPHREFQVTQCDIVRHCLRKNKQWLWQAAKQSTVTLKIRVVKVAEPRIFPERSGEGVYRPLQPLIDFYP